MASRKNKAEIIPIGKTKQRPYDAAVEKEQNIIGTRIAQLRKEKGLSLAALSRLLGEYGLGIQRTGLSRWESGDAVPNAYQLVALSCAFEIEDVDYFTGQQRRPPELSQEGLHKLAEYKADLIATGKYRPNPQPIAKLQYIEMPVSNLAVSAGTGAFLEEDSFEQISFPANTVPKGAEFGVRVSGDSMEPVYHDGQIVWVQSCQELLPGQVGIFLYDGNGYLKVYEEQEPDEAEKESFLDCDGVLHMQPVLVSYNEKYAPRVVSPELNFQIAGRVLN